jgi:hypothetical protein
MGYRLLSSLACKALPVALLILVPAIAPLAQAAEPKATGNPFEQLSGVWKGGGTVTPVNGDAKKVACKVAYKVAGSTLSQNLRCAGTDYRIDATTKLTDKGGKIKGSWNESTYDANGGVIGTANDKTIHAKITGDKFSGRMSINVSDADHEINIMQFNETSGTYRPVASVSMHR